MTQFSRRLARFNGIFQSPLRSGISAVPFESVLPRRTLLVRAAAVAALSFVVLFLAMDRRINLYDEGIILTGAIRINAGDVIHRDFYANYGPLAFLPVSCLIEFLGQDVMACRVADTTARALAVAFAFAISSRYIVAPWIVGLVTAISGGWLLSVGNYGYPIYPAWVLALCSTALLTQVQGGTGNMRLALLAGVMSGTCALIRYDIGLFVCIAHAIGAILNRVYDPDRKSISFGETAAYVAGAGMPVGALLAWYAQIGALDGFIHDVVKFPVECYARTRALPFPGADRILSRSGITLFAVYLPVLIVALLPAGLLMQRRERFRAKREVVPPDAAFLLATLLACLTGMLYLKGIVRVSIEHMQLAILSCTLLLGLLIDRRRPSGFMWRSMLAVSGFLMVFITATSVYQNCCDRQFMIARNLPQFFQLARTSGRNTAQDTGTPAENAVFFVDEPRSAAIRFLIARTQPSERVFIGVKHHDKVYINDVSAYFLTNRLPATHWHHFDPGLQTNVSIQLDMIAELEHAKPALVWIESTWDDVIEPNESAISSGVTLLDDYLSQRYTVQETFGSIELRRRL